MSLPYLILASGTVFATGATLVWSMKGVTDLRDKDWDELVQMLQPVHFRGLELVARDHIDPRGNQLRIEPGEMWALLGGPNGLRRMKQNADVMIAIAAYASRWNMVEAAIVAERMRQDAIMLKRALLRIRMEAVLHRRPVRFPFYLHQAASSYYLMLRRLLCLYEENHAGLHPRLAAAL
jgi:hypothetical protein